MKKYGDLGLFKTGLEVNAGTTRMIRVTEDPQIGQYVFNDQTREWTLHPKETGHFIGNYIMVHGPTTFEVLEYSWSVAHVTSDIPNMKIAMLEAELTERYIRTMYPESAHLVLQGELGEHPLYKSSLRYVRFFITGFLLLEGRRS